MKKNWVEKAYSAVVDAANSYDTFSTDEVWEALEIFGEKAPADSRLMGSVIKRAEAERVIIGTFNFKRSRRGINHGRPVRLWRSGL